MLHCRYMQGSCTKQTGFTIVELLIVVVVIAILAAITIISYNGITNRAKNSVASSAAASASKKVQSYMVANADQVPGSLSDAGVSDSNGTTYQYGTNTSTVPQSYCVTATVNGVSFFINNTTVSSPQPGACPGQGANGAVAISNLVTNPSVETDRNDWDFVGSGSNGMVIQPSRETTGGVNGSSFARLKITTAPTTATSLALWVSPVAQLPTTASAQYSASLYIRSSHALSFVINAVPLASNNAYNGGEVYGPVITLAPGVWTRLSTTITVPAGTQSVKLRARYGGASIPPVNATLDADAALFVAGSTLYSYADGNTANWAWSGVQNNSTSSGVPLP